MGWWGKGAGPGGGLVRGASTVRVTTSYGPATVPNSSSALRHLSSPGNPVGSFTEEETETQKIKYLGQTYRPGIQADFCMVPDPSFGILSGFPNLRLGCRAWGLCKGYFLKAVPWGRVKLRLVWEGAEVRGTACRRGSWRHWGRQGTGVGPGVEEAVKRTGSGRARCLSTS